MTESVENVLDLEALKLQWSRLFGGVGADTQTAIYATIGVLVVTLFLLIWVVTASFRSKKGDSILLLGPSGSGKTVLFYQLRDGSIHGGTVTSMEPNEDKFILHAETTRKGNFKPVHVVDLPGHPRLRPLLEQYLPKAEGIVFVVDALDFVPSVRSTAEYLYDVLSTPIVVKRKIPVLVICNKVDKVTAHSMDFIRKQLEKEMEKLRTTRSSLGDGGMNSDNVVRLGKDGEPFKLTHCLNKVSINEASGITGNISQIQQFIREHV